MIDEIFYKFRISENSSNYLYDIICILEDSDIEYTITNDLNSILLNPKSLIDSYSKIYKLLNNGIELVRRGKRIELINIDIDCNKFISFDNRFFVNPFNGSWYDNRNNPEKIKSIEEGLINYSKCDRGNYIDLSNILREVLNYGLLDDNIKRKILDDYYIFKYYIEIKYSVVKLKFIGDNPKNEYEEFTQNKFFTRCIPWKDGNSYGVWTWPKRYLSGGAECYPNYDVDFIDLSEDLPIIYNKIEASNGFSVQSKFKNLYYINLNNNRFQCVVNDLNRFFENNCFGTLDSNYIINYQNYLNSNPDRKGEIESFLRLLRDSGFISIQLNDIFKNVYGWGNLLKFTL